MREAQDSTFSIPVEGHIDVLLHLIRENLQVFLKLLLNLIGI